MMRMVLLICLVSFGAGREQGMEQCRDTLSVLFWNLENYFDWKENGGPENTSDKEFSSSGLRHWNRKRFLAKSNAIAKTLYWLEDRNGSLPDVIGVAEVENASVLGRLLASTTLRKTDYAYVHYDSPDPRGIDVALLYRKSRLELVGSAPLKVGDGSRPFLTRDILLAVFRTEGSDTVAFLVNHHPSKYGSDSEWKRVAALERLRSAVDSVQEHVTPNIVAMGDFNDTPDNPSFRIMTDGGNGMLNLAGPCHDRGEGTIRYSGKWDMIDMFFVSREIGNRLDGDMEIVHVPFLTVWDNTHSGEKPLRTYSGPRYLGGVSDHCPVHLKVPM